MSKDSCATQRQDLFQRVRNRRCYELHSRLVHGPLGPSKIISMNLVHWIGRCLQNQSSDSTPTNSRSCLKTSEITTPQLFSSSTRSSAIEEMLAQVKSELLGFQSRPPPRLLISRTSLCAIGYVALATCRKIEHMNVRLLHGLVFGNNAFQVTSSLRARMTKLNLGSKARCTCANTTCNHGFRRVATLYGFDPCHRPRLTAEESWRQLHHCSVAYDPKNDFKGICHLQ